MGLPGTSSLPTLQAPGVEARLTPGRERVKMPHNCPWAQLHIQNCWGVWLRSVLTPNSQSEAFTVWAG